MKKGQTITLSDNNSKLDLQKELDNSFSDKPQNYFGVKKGEGLKTLMDWDLSIFKK